MKISFTKALIFITAIILTFNANAQSDYVITVKGDSIPCKISIPLIGSNKYKSDAMSGPEKIKPDVIKEYYIARKNFRQRAVFRDNSTKPTYMTVIERGKISLYEMVYSNYYNGMTTTTVTWYVSKGSDNVSDLKTSALFSFKSRQTRKDDFAEMLKDNKVVYDLYISEDKFSFKQIRNLVHLYNTGQPFAENIIKEPDNSKNEFNPNQK